MFVFMWGRCMSKIVMFIDSSDNYDIQIKYNNTI